MSRVPRRRRSSDPEWRGGWPGPANASSSATGGRPPGACHAAASPAPEPPAAAIATPGGHLRRVRHRRCAVKPAGRRGSTLAARIPLDRGARSSGRAPPLAVARGVAMVVDPGTGTYYADPRLREWLASRGAHNGPAPIGSTGRGVWARSCGRSTIRHRPRGRRGCDPGGALPRPAGPVRRAIGCIDRRGSDRVERSSIVADRSDAVTSACAGSSPRARRSNDRRARLARDARRRGDRVIAAAVGRDRRPVAAPVSPAFRASSTRRSLALRAGAAGLRPASSDPLPAGVMKIAIFGLGYVGSVTGACLAAAATPSSASTYRQRRSRPSPAAKRRSSSPASPSSCARRARPGASTRPPAPPRRSRPPTSRWCASERRRRSPATLDVSFVRQVAREIAAALARSPKRHALVLRSTLLPGTTRALARPRSLAARARLRRARPLLLPRVPARRERRRRLRRRRRSPRSAPPTARRRRRRMRGESLRTRSTPSVTWETAELLKYASNAFHATKIAFANEIGRFGKSLGVDARPVHGAARDRHQARALVLLPQARQSVRRLVPAQGPARAGAPRAPARPRLAAARERAAVEPAPSREPARAGHRARAGGRS